MVSRLPVNDDDGEVGDLSELDPALFKPCQELPASLQAKLRGRPKAAVTKERITHPPVARRGGDIPGHGKWLANARGCRPA